MIDLLAKSLRDLELKFENQTSQEKYHEPKGYAINPFDTQLVDDKSTENRIGPQSKTKQYHP